MLKAPLELLNYRDAEGRTPSDVATNPKVRSLLEQYFNNEV